MPGHGSGPMANGIFPSKRVEKFLSVAEDSLKQTLPPVGSGWLPAHLASLLKLTPLGRFGFRFFQRTMFNVSEGP